MNIFSLPTEMSAKERQKRLEEIYLSGVQSNRGQVCSVETLLDVLVVLYDECNSSNLRREKTVAEFVSYAQPIVKNIKNLRLQRDDFETLKIIGRGAFGEVAVVKLKVSDNMTVMTGIKDRVFPRCIIVISLLSDQFGGLLHCRVEPRVHPHMVAL